MSERPNIVVEVYKAILNNILSFPSLTIACDILYLHFTPISVVMTTPYMSDSVYKSQSLVLCSSVCN